MDHPILLKQLSYLMIPFTYSKRFKEISSIQNFTDKPMKTEKVYDHVNSLVSNDPANKNTIGKAYTLDANKRTKIGLPNKKNDIILYKVKEHTFAIEIQAIDMYLFHTQVGFLAFKIISHGIINEQDYTLQREKNVTINELILTNYYLKKFFYKTNEMYFNRRVSKDKTEKTGIDFERLIKHLTSGIDVHSYFAENSMKPNHSLLFTAVYLEKSNADYTSDIPQYLFYLRKTFKDTYLPSSSELVIDGNDEIYQPFANSFWGVSLEGIANIAYETGNAKTDAFFENNFFHNLEKTYFYLYILVLYQKYSLLQMSVKAGELHQQIEGKDFAEQERVVNAFREEVIDFTVRGLYKQVSYISHHADLYHRMKNRLGIEHLHDELTPEIDALSTYIQVAEDKDRKKKEDQKKEKKDRTNMLIQILTLIFLPITVITGFFNVDIPFNDTLTNERFYYSLGVIYLLSFIGFWVFRRLLNRKTPPRK